MNPMRRNWLHPRWYIKVAPPFRFEGVYPDSVEVTGNSEPVICAECGVDAMESYGAASTYNGVTLCPDCDEAKRLAEPPVKPPSWITRRIIWKTRERVDQFYWWYCKRFGERIYQE